MAHSLDCPTCELTTRVSDELYTRKVRGRRVKLLCKGCRQHMVVDATTEEVHVAPFRAVAGPLASGDGAKRVQPRAPRAPSRAPGAPTRAVTVAPTVTAPPLVEDELPTLPRNELPEDEAFLSPVAGSLPPAAWSQSFAPLDSGASSRGFAAPAPRRRRRMGILAVAALCLGAVGAWATHPALAGFAATLFPGAAESAALEEPAARETARAAASPAADDVPTPALDAVEPRQESSAETLAKPSARPLATSSAQPLAEPSAQPLLEASTGDSVPAATEAPARTHADDEAASPAGPFDRAAAAAALRAAEAQASTCRGAGDPSGTARVVVTFAPSGRITSATVSGPPFAGTATGGCVASRFRAARVPKYEGSYVTVAKTVVLH